jgi:uncharacterized protein YhfF
MCYHISSSWFKGDQMSLLDKLMQMLGLGEKTEAQAPEAPVQPVDTSAPPQA